ncbi:MAG: hypothetical protein UY63_C0005G0027 [Parcubacteria group bacterium GW2011_GWA2_51_10]|nr:MAG: hypothetical protein UY63_C0005G0027 [Parcubacteria group bacterium GW2011_GWA2_51_10]
MFTQDSHKESAMKRSDLRIVKPVAIVADSEYLKFVLGRIMHQDVRFTHYAPIEGEPRSGRLLLAEHAFDAVAIRSPLSVEGMVRQLVEISRTWRYEPPHYYGKTHAFEVWCVMMPHPSDSLFAAAVWAAWL